MKIPAPQDVNSVTSLETNGELVEIGQPANWGLQSCLRFPKLENFGYPKILKLSLKIFYYKIIICHVMGVFGTLLTFSVGGGGSEYFKYVV